MSITSHTLSLGANLPVGWDYHGCWSDHGRRKLGGPSYVDSLNMTQNNCIAFCYSNKYPYAGIEYGQECYCGLIIGAESEKKDDRECNFKCPGAADEACGSGNRLTVFYTELLNFTRTNPGPPSTSHIGCVTDDVYARALPIAQSSKDDMTVAQCTSSCKSAGFTIAGLEYGRECFCGNDFNNNAAVTDEGCDMRCTGDSTEFCGGYARMDAYALNVTATAASGSAGSTSAACSPTSRPGSHVLNGGFEEGLADWTAVAYNASSSAFDVGLTKETMEGCTALSVVPKPDNRALAQHLQISTDLFNLEPQQNYILNISIGHRKVDGAKNPSSDPKYSIRLSNTLLGYGPVCGFAYSPCPLIGLNNSTYSTLSLPFQADDRNETLTVYMSWYNANFDVPIYLDAVAVQPSNFSTPDSSGSTRLSLKATSSESLRTTSLASLSTINTISSSQATSSAVETKKPGPADKTCPTPESCKDEPPVDITDKTLSNSGFETGLEGWDFLQNEGTFDIGITNQSFEGNSAASITPRSSDISSRRFITLQTRMTGLNPLHEWYRVALYIGHSSSPSLSGSTPSFTMKYKNDVSGDIERRVSLCGAVNPATFPCPFVGNTGGLYQKYGMDPRLFLGTDNVTVNGTEILIELEIKWEAGVQSTPVYIDAMKAWEIKWGTVS